MKKFEDNYEKIMIPNKDIKFKLLKSDKLLGKDTTTYHNYNKRVYECIVGDTDDLYTLGFRDNYYYVITDARTNDVLGLAYINMYSLMHNININVLR